MAINPSTLNNLYADGSINYNPFLSSGSISSMMPSMPMMQNAYLNTAQQGALYRGLESYNDSFNQVNSELVHALAPNRPSSLHKKNHGFLRILKQAHGVEEGTVNQNYADNFVGTSASYNNANEGKKAESSIRAIKGILSASVVLGTLAFLFRGKKVPKS